MLNSQIRNLRKDEISDLGKGKTQHKQLPFPALLLDNNTTSTGWGAASWETGKGQGIFHCICKKFKAERKILFILKFTTKSCSPINSISSHLENHESGSKIIIKLTWKNCWGEVVFYFFFLLWISAFLYTSALTLYVTVFSSSYSGATNNSRSKMFMEKHRANMAWATASHTTHEVKKNYSVF